MYHIMHLYTVGHSSLPCPSIVIIAVSLKAQIYVKVYTCTVNTAHSCKTYSDKRDGSDPEPLPRDCTTATGRNGSYNHVC